MDPIANVKPDRDGYIALSDSIQLHYELYDPPSAGPASASKGKVLVVMGAFATKDHFAGTARHLADHGYEVCMYDHRGVGRSSPPTAEQQTALMLAKDAVTVTDHIWGSNTAVHVYGASMGGMVAQELALLLLPQNRLISLGLAVTCRGLKPLGGLLSPVIKPRILKPLLQAWYWDSRPALVRRLMRLVLSRSLLDMVHPCGETYEEVYFREWLAHFEDWWTFKDHMAGACHACVVLTHWLSERQITILRDSGVPILCQISTQDHLIPPAMQFELADKLRAKTVTFPTGHMGLMPWQHRYHNMLLEHFAAATALRGVADTQASHAWRFSKAVLAQHQMQVVPNNQPSKSLSTSSSSSSGQYIGTSPADPSSSSSSSSSFNVPADLTSCSSCSCSSADLTLTGDADTDLSVDVSEWSGSNSCNSAAADVYETVVV